MKKKRSLLILLFIGGISFWFFITSNKLAPNLNFTTITGKKIELATLQNKPVIITFWATDCASCIKEIPALIDLYRQFHHKGLEIIAIAMYYDIPSHVVEMTKAKQLPYDVTLDLKANYAEALGQIQLTPTTLLISPSGHIVMQKTGLFDVLKMKQKIEKLLKDTSIHSMKY